MTRSAPIGVWSVSTLAVVCAASFVGERARAVDDAAAPQVAQVERAATQRDAPVDVAPPSARGGPELRRPDRPPLDERIFTGSAQNEVAITATFSGQELFVYGAIARNRFLDSLDGAPDVVIVVRGPSGPVMVRKKNRVAGLWMNTEAIRIAAAPSYYAVASTRPLEEALRPDVDATFKISLDKAVLILGLPSSVQDPEQFRQAAVRLRQRQGLYREAPYGVDLKGGTLFQTRLRLPADIVEGAYQVTVYLLRDGVVRDQAQIAIPVRKQGIEAAVASLAEELPLVYGLATLLTALLCGWVASEVFRRLRR